MTTTHFIAPTSSALFARKSTTHRPGRVQQAARWFRHLRRERIGRPAGTDLSRQILDDTSSIRSPQR